MIVLGIDGALADFSVGFWKDGEAFASGTCRGKQALENGLKPLAEILEEAGVQPSDIDRLAVGVGPGSFTGVRIAISYAKSLALGWKRPLVPVNSFDAIEAGMSLREPLLTVVRGRSGVISVRYRAAGQERRASGYIADVLEQLDDGGGPLTVVGDAEDVLSGLAERGYSVHHSDRAIRPTALAVAAVAATREVPRSSHEVRADYGELPAAKVPKF
jgi:tRNA threonylcarbamoyladenosine biosynthesis protein TsaB